MRYFVRPHPQPPGYDLGAIYLKLLVTKENTPALVSTGGKPTTEPTSNPARRDPLGHALF